MLSTVLKSHYPQSRVPQANPIAVRRHHNLCFVLCSHWCPLYQTGIYIFWIPIVLSVNPRRLPIFFKYLFSLFCFFSLHGQWPIQHMVDSVNSNNFLSTAACQIVLKLHSKMWKTFFILSKFQCFVTISADMINWKTTTCKTFLAAICINILQAPVMKGTADS